MVAESVIERNPAAMFTTKFDHDDLGNVTSTTDPRGAVTSGTFNAASEQLTSTDALGKVTKLTYNVAGQPTSSVDPLGRKASTTYDAAGRPVKLTHFDASGASVRSESATYDPAGNVVSSTSPNGFVTSRTYDAASQLRSITESVNANKAITTRFGYDAEGNRSFVTNGNGATTWTLYNALNLRSSVIEPSTPSTPNEVDRRWNYSYDQTGNPTVISAPGGVVRTSTYDELGRRVSETGTGGAGPDVARTHGYDLAGRLTSVWTPMGPQTFTRNDRGLITSQSGHVGNATFTYDANGQMLSRSNLVGTTSYSYCEDGCQAVTA